MLHERTLNENEFILKFVPNRTENDLPFIQVYSTSTIKKPTIKKPTI